MLRLLFLFCFFIYFSENVKSQTTCSQFYLNNKPPKVNIVTHNNCYNKYAIGYSDITFGNIYSAEILTKDQIQSTFRMKRYGHFDYKNSVIRNYIKTGYDRGHMTPSGDMPDYNSQVQTFIWKNIIPQDHHLNSGKWNWIEHQTRLLALKYQKLYVVTGPIFNLPVKTIGYFHIWVPYAVFKAIYIPVLNRGSVYVCYNKNNSTCYITSISFFTHKTGIDPFPALGSSVKRKKFELPKLHD